VLFPGTSQKSRQISRSRLEGACESAYLRHVKWFKHYYYYYYNYNEERRAASWREGKVTAGVAACAVGATTSLLLWVITYTEETTNRTANLLISSNVHYAHLGRDNESDKTDKCWDAVWRPTVMMHRVQTWCLMKVHFIAKTGWICLLAYSRYCQIVVGA